MGVWVHRLTNVDSENRKAMCRQCGPVELVKRSGKPYWRCKTARGRPPAVASVARPLPPPTDLAYLAGFFDGEGCVTIGLHKRSRWHDRHYVFVTVSNTDHGIIQTLKTEFGGHTYRDDRHRTPNERACYRWSLSARKACVFLRAIRPYLRLKAEQTDVALALQSTNDWSRLTPERLANREVLRAKITQMKRVS